MRLIHLFLLFFSLFIAQLAQATDTQVTHPKVDLWRVGLHYFQGTTNDFSEAIVGQWDEVDPDGVRTNLSYVMINELWNLPMDLLVDFGFMLHDEHDYQNTVRQVTLSVKLSWTEFPWNNYLRTRVAFSEGLSYVSDIPVTEKWNRGSESSSNLLNYLEPSIAINCGDVFRLIGFPLQQSNALLRTWLVFSIPHRSGVFGLFGEDDEGETITGGSNYLSLGLEFDFSFL